MVRAIGVALLFLLFLAVPANARTTPPECPLRTPLFTSKNTPLNLPAPDCGTVQVVTLPLHGTMATTNPTLYTPAAGFRGLDEFQYTLTTASGTSDPATVEILVNTPPTCDDGTASVVGNQRRVFYDFDCDEADGDAFTIYVDDPQHGTITFPDDGTVVYTPNPGYVGADSFTYSALEDDEDLGLESELATMNITVTTPAPIVIPMPIAVIRPPIAAPKPPADVTAPVIKLKNASKKQAAAIALTTNENSSATLTLTLDKATARKLKLSRTVGQIKAALTPGTATIGVKLSAKARKAFKKLKRVNLTLTAVVTDTAGNTITKTLAVTLKK